EGVRLALRVGVQAGKIKRAAEVAAILEATPAPVRYLESPLHEVLRGRPADAFHQLKVALGAGEICLGSASRERARDDDALRLRDAGRRLALVAGEELKLIQQRGTKDRLLRVGNLLFGLREIGADAGQRG